MVAVNARDVTTIVTALTAEVRTRVSGLVARIGQNVQSRVDEAQSCMATFVFRPTVPALRVKLTDTVLGEVTPALQAVLS